MPTSAVLDDVDAFLARMDKRDMDRID